MARALTGTYLELCCMRCLLAQLPITVLQSKFKLRLFLTYTIVCRTELFHNIEKGPLKLPVSMSTNAKNIIVNLLNRNPSKRLGAGQDGADEIKRHPFFSGIDWDKVASR